MAKVQTLRKAKADAGAASSNGAPPRHAKIPILKDPGLEARLRRRAELLPLAREFQALDGEIRESLRGIPQALVGDWRIVGRWVRRKAHTVPEGEYWRCEIERVGG